MRRNTGSEKEDTIHLTEMFYRLICLSLCVLLHVLGQATDQPADWTTEFDNTLDGTEATTESPFDETTDFDTTDNSESYTTDYENVTATEEPIAMTTNSVMATTEQSNSSCPETIDRETLEKMKNDMVDQILVALSKELSKQLEALEARLANSTVTKEQVTSPVELDWQIYENLQIKLHGWTLVFDQPYSHKTRLEDLTQVAGICHNHVLVGATLNGTMSLAAVGPSSVLTLNTQWNQPQQFGQVYWYRNSGKSFGFSPSSTIRQTSGDNEDLSSPWRLSWALDQNIGGYRAGATRSLHDNSLWHKVIYCN